MIRSQKLIIPSDSQFMIHGIMFEEDDEKNKQIEIEYMKKAGSSKGRLTTVNNADEGVGIERGREREFPALSAKKD